MNLDHYKAGELAEQMMAAERARLDASNVAPRVRWPFWAALAVTVMLALAVMS